MTEEISSNRKRMLPLHGLASAVFLVIAAAFVWRMPSNSKATDTTKDIVAVSPLHVTKIATLGAPDPTASYWKSATVAVIPLLPQTITKPTIEKSEIHSMEVQAVSDGTNIAWRLAWADPEADSAVDSGKFSDACAIQFPIGTNTNLMMGHGGEVEIFLWKAIWQRDVNLGFQDIRDLHPNAWTDLYWFSKGGLETNIKDAFADPRAKQWMIALTAGNPMSQMDRKQPCEECTAKGFGTIATQAQQSSQAVGVWAGGQWAVVFQRPLRTEDVSDYQFGLHASEFALAVWQGSAKQAGGRKQFSGWVPFELLNGIIK